MTGTSEKDGPWPVHVELDGLTHTCKSSDCHVPSFVTALRLMRDDELNPTDEWAEVSNAAVEQLIYRYTQCQADGSVRNRVNCVRLTEELAPEILCPCRTTVDRE